MPKLGCSRLPLPALGCCLPPCLVLIRSHAGVGSMPQRDCNVGNEPPRKPCCGKWGTNETMLFGSLRGTIWPHVTSDLPCVLSACWDSFAVRKLIRESPEHTKSKDSCGSNTGLFRPVFLESLALSWVFCSPSFLEAQKFISHEKNQLFKLTKQHKETKILNWRHRMHHRSKGDPIVFTLFDDDGNVPETLANGARMVFDYWRSFWSLREQQAPPDDHLVEVFRKQRGSAGPDGCGWSGNEVRHLS